MNLLRSLGHLRCFSSIVVTSIAAVSAHANVINGGFEDPTVSTLLLFSPTMPGWTTSEPIFEIWRSGFLGISSFQGNQFVEMNGITYGTYTQDILGIPAGQRIGFYFAHRAREGSEAVPAGNDIVRFTLTDLGGNGVAGGGDDTTIFSKDYSDGLNWVLHDSTSESALFALGDPIEIKFESVFNVGGIGKGNLLDDVGFGAADQRGAVIPETGSAAGFLLIGGGALILARRNQARQSA